jgi:hypothetical protein
MLGEEDATSKECHILVLSVLGIKLQIEQGFI